MLRGRVSCVETARVPNQIWRHYKRRHPNVQNIPEPRRGSRKAEKVSASKTRSAAVSSEEASQAPVHIRQVATGSSTRASGSSWQQAVHTVTSSAKEAVEGRIDMEVGSYDEETEVEKEETSELECESMEAAMRFRPLSKDGGGKNSKKPKCRWNSLAERWAERVLRCQLAMSLSPVGNLPEAEGSPVVEENEVRRKEYLRALQAQDISPIKSESEATAEFKLRLEDIEEVVDRVQTVNADVQFVSAGIVIYAGDGFEDGMEDLEI